MNDEEKKKKETIPNKAYSPAENKTMVRIRMRPGRSAEGVKPDRNGYASVTAETAEYLIKIGYATKEE